MDTGTQTVLMNITTILATVAVFLLKRWNKDTNALFRKLRDLGLIEETVKPARKRAAKARSRRQA